MTTNERVRYLRKEVLKLTQQDFSKALNISRSNMGNIETGQISLTERIILDICEKFNVNETWLRTGEGEMFIQKTRNQQITDFLGDLIKEDDGVFKKRLIEAMSKLDKRDWEDIERLVNKLTKKDQAEA